MKMKNILTRAMALILTGAACIGGLHTEASAMTACQTYYKELFPQDFGTMFPDADDKNSPGADRFRAWMKENNKEATLVWLKKYCGEPIYTSDDGVSYYYYPGNAEEESFYIGYMGERNFQYDGQKLMFSPVDYGKKLILGKGETITLGTNYNYNKTQEYQRSMGENGSHVTAVSDGNVVYSSSNEKVATVDGKGKVKAKKKGKTTITASVTNDKYLSKVDKSELKYFTISVDVEVRNKPKKSEALSYGMKYCKKETKALSENIVGCRAKNICKIPMKNDYIPESDTKAFKDGCRDAGKYVLKLFDKWKSGMITAKEAKKLVRAVKVWTLEDEFNSKGMMGRNLRCAMFTRGSFTYTCSLTSKLPFLISDFLDITIPKERAIYYKVLRNSSWLDKLSVYYDKKKHKYRMFTGGTSYYTTGINADDLYFGSYVFPNGKRLYESSSSGWRKTGDEGANTITIIKDGTIKDIINISFGAFGESFMNLNSRGEGWGAFSLYADELDDYGLGFLRR